MADEIQKLILQVENDNKIRDLVKLLDQQHLAMAKVIEQQKQGAISVQQYEAAMKASAATMVQYNAQVAQLQASSGPSQGMRTQGMMAAGYLAQDMMSQHSVAGAINAGANNIPGIAMGMGMGANPQAMMAVMIGTAVAQALATALPSIIAAIKARTPEEEKREAERQKSDKEKAAEFTKGIAAPTSGQAGFAANVAGQIGALGGGALSSLRGAVAGGMSASPEAIMAEIRRTGGDGSKQRDILAARSVVENRMAEQKALELIERAKQGDEGAIAEIQQLAAKNPELNDLAEAAKGMRSPTPGVGPGRAEAAEQMMRDAARGGGPAYFPSRIFGSGQGGKTPQQQAREQAQQAQNAARAAYRANMGQPGQAEAANDREALRLAAQGNQIANGLQFMAEQAAGLAGPATQSLQQLVERLQQIESQSAALPMLMRRLSNLNGGAGNGTQYSASPVANW